MKEYENFYDREDISVFGLDPLHNYGLQRRIYEVKDMYPDDTRKQMEVIREYCSLDWPCDWDGPIDKKIIDYVGLQNRTKEAMCAVYKEFTVIPKSQSQLKFIVRAFYYEGKRWFYWWDMYKNNEVVQCGLEFFPWCDHPASYLIFATKLNQSPLMCTDEFKHIRQE